MRSSVLIVGFVGLMLMNAASIAASQADAPGIYIKRIGSQGDTFIKALRIQYEICVASHAVNQELAKKQPAIWAELKEQEQPGYLVHATPDVEPLWDKLKVGVYTVEEYFFGDKYAVYKRRADYSFSEDGRCRLQIKEVEQQDLDNGVNRIMISLEDKIDNLGSTGKQKGNDNNPATRASLYKKRRVSRSRSSLAARKKNKRELQALAKNNPAIAKFLLSQLQMPANAAPGVGDGFTTRSSDKLVEAFQYKVKKPTKNLDIPRQNDEHLVAGQLCDIYEITFSVKSRLWLWHEMNYYPSIHERPIVLKHTVDPWGDETVEEAVEFKVLKTIDKKIFEPQH